MSSFAFVISNYFINNRNNYSLKILVSTFGYGSTKYWTFYCIGRSTKLWRFSLITSGSASGKYGVGLNGKVLEFYLLITLCKWG